MSSTVSSASGVPPASSDSPAAAAGAAVAGSKRPYEEDAHTHAHARGSHKYARGNEAHGHTHRGGRGGGRAVTFSASASAAAGHHDHDLSKYLTPVAASSAHHAQPLSSTYSCATGEMVSAASSAVGSSSGAASAADGETPIGNKPIVYCQKFMNNLCQLRSHDEPPSDEEEGGGSTGRPSVGRCEFVHDAAFRRAFLAKAHYSHTKFSQNRMMHEDGHTHSHHGRGGRGGGRHSRGGHSSAESSSRGEVVDGKLAGLKPPVAESALLRKVKYKAQHNVRNSRHTLSHSDDILTFLFSSGLSFPLCQASRL